MSALPETRSVVDGGVAVRPKSAVVDRQPVGAEVRFDLSAAAKRTKTVGTASAKGVVILVGELPNTSPFTPTGLASAGVEAVWLTQGFDVVWLMNTGTKSLIVNTPTERIGHRVIATYAKAELPRVLKDLNESVAIGDSVPAFGAVHAVMVLDPLAADVYPALDAADIDAPVIGVLADFATRDGYKATTALASEGVSLPQQHLVADERVFNLSRCDALVCGPNDLKLIVERLSTLLETSGLISRRIFRGLHLDSMPTGKALRNMLSTLIAPAKLPSPQAAAQSHERPTTLNNLAKGEFNDIGERTTKLVDRVQDGLSIGDVGLEGDGIGHVLPTPGNNEVGISGL